MRLQKNFLHRLLRRTEPIKKIPPPEKLNKEIEGNLTAVGAKLVVLFGTPKASHDNGPIGENFLRTIKEE